MARAAAAGCVRRLQHLDALASSIELVARDSDYCRSFGRVLAVRVSRASVAGSAVRWCASSSLAVPRDAFIGQNEYVGTAGLSGES